MKLGSLKHKRIPLWVALLMLLMVGSSTVLASITLILVSQKKTLLMHINIVPPPSPLGLGIQLYQDPECTVPLTEFECPTQSLIMTQNADPNEPAKFAAGFVNPEGMMQGYFYETPLFWIKNIDNVTVQWLWNSTGKPVDGGWNEQFWNGWVLHRYLTYSFGENNGYLTMKFRAPGYGHYWDCAQDCCYIYNAIQLPGHWCQQCTVLSAGAVSVAFLQFFVSLDAQLGPHDFTLSFYTFYDPYAQLIGYAPQPTGPLGPPQP